MPGIIVDEFSAKPQGFLASWRAIRVTCNTDTHEIGTVCVPNKECINLNNLADYQKVSRRYKANDLITTFCDLVTFERVSIFAQDVRPFAYTTVETNVAACGYQTPIPTPAVPPNPWGDVVYGLYKTYEFCDETLAYNYEVLIYKKDFAGIQSAIVNAGAFPVTERYSRDEKFETVVGREMTFTFIATEEFNLSEFYSDDERQFKVDVYRNGSLYMAGFIVPDLAQEPFKNYPYPVLLTVTDGLALLKKQSYPVPTFSTLAIQQPFLYMLIYCLAQTGLRLDLLTVCNLFEQTMSNGANDDPLLQAKANPLRLADDLGNIGNSYEMLDEIAKLFGAIICQVNGQWTFVRVNELAYTMIRGRVYNYTGFFLYPTQLTPVLNIGLGEDVEVINDNAVQDRGEALKYVNVKLKYGFLPSTVYNGGFEIWDGSNFTYWTIFGGLNFSRVQRTLPGANGQPVLIDNYAFQFNEVFSPFKFAKPAVITGNVGDTMVLTFNLGSSGYVDEFIFRMKIGEYWLKNSDARDIIADQQNGTQNLENSGTYEWVKTGLATATLLTGAGTKNINTYQVQITIPAFPTFGQLEIFICGFRSWNTAAQMVNGVVTTKLVPRTYYPVQIDNVAVAITKNPSENTPDGVLYKSEQGKNYTNSKSLEVVWGDNTTNAIFQSVNQRRFEYDPLKDNLHSIFTSDNSYSKLWYDYSADSTKLPIAAHLAKGILKAHQRGYAIMDCDLRGFDVSYLSVFNICTIPGKQFMFLTMEYNLIKNQFNNCTLVEMFDRVVQSQDTSVISTPALINAIIPQDQNALPYVPDDYDRIFYPQFDDEFT